MNHSVKSVAVALAASGPCRGHYCRLRRQPWSDTRQESYRTLAGADRTELRPRYQGYCLGFASVTALASID